MAGTKIIGRVGVKVIPELDDFHRTLERELKRETRDAKVEVEPELDGDSAKRQLREMLARLKEQVKAANLDVKSEVKVDVDRKEVDRVKTVLDDLAKPELFKKLRHQEIFDPSSIRQYQSRIRTVLDETRAVAKVDAQRTAALRDAARAAKDLEDANRRAYALQTQAEREMRKDVDDRAKAVKEIEDSQRRAYAFQAQAEREMRKDFEERAKAARAAVSDTEKMRRDLDKIQFNKNFETTTAHVSALLGQVDAEIRDIDKHLNANLRLKVSGMSEAEREIDQLKIKLESVNAKITPEIDELTRRKLIHEAQKLHDEIEDKTKNLKVSFDMKTPSAQIRLMSARLAYLARTRIVTLIPVVSKAAATKAATALAALSGARLGKELLSDLWDMVKNLDKAIPMMALLGTGIAGVAGWALSASANLFSLSAELARIGPAALALPGILTGVGIALGVFVIAMTDIKKVIPGVVKQWSGLKKTISDNFWSKAAQPLRQLTSVIMPQLTKGLAGASTEVGTLFGAFGSDLAKRLTGNGALTRMFSDLGDSLAILTKHTSSWAGIITILGEQGAGMLPRLSTWFGTISDDFNAFLEKAQYSGQLQDWIDNGIQGLQELGGAIKQIVRFFGGLAKIANKAGGATFKAVGDTFQHAADAVNKPRFQDQMVKVLLAADKAMDNIAKKSGPGLVKLFDTLGTTAQIVLPKIGTIIGTALGGVAKALARPALQQGINNFFTGVLSLVQDLQPAMAPLGDALGAILTLAGRMATAFGPSLATILTTVANVVKIIAPYVGDAVDALAGPFGEILKAVAPPIERIAKAVGPKLVDFAKGFGKFLTNISPDVGKTFGKLATFMEKSTKFKAKDIQGFFDSLEHLTKSSLDVLNQIIDFGTWLTGPDGRNAILGVQAIAAACQQIGDQAKFASEMLDTLKGKGDALGVGANKKANGGKFDFGQYLKDTFTNNPLIGDLLGPVGGTIMSSLVGGMESAKHFVQEWLQGLTLLIPLWKGPPDTDATLLTPAGYDIIMSLIAGFDSARDAVMGWLKSLTDAIKGVFLDAGTWLVGTGVSIGQGLASGISSQDGTVSGAAKSLLSAAHDGANNPALLAGIGAAIGLGYARALGNQAGSAYKAGHSLGTSARSGGDSVSMFSTGTWVGRGFVNGIRSQMRAAYDAGSGLAHAADTGARYTGKIASPSKLFHQLGVWVGEGWENGILSKTGDSLKAASTMAQGAVNAIVNPAQMMLAAGMDTGNAFADGIDSARNAVKKSVQGLTSSISPDDLAVGQVSATSSLKANVQANLVDPATVAAGAGKKVEINVTQNNPVAERDSVMLNDAMQLAALLV